MTTETPAEKTWKELETYRVDSVEDYLTTFAKILESIKVNSPERAFHSSVNKAIQSLSAVLRKALTSNRQLIVIGNGGSAAIAMHVLADYANAGRLRTMDLMNSALLTCMANDYGYGEVFAKNIARFAQECDILFAISSSGHSENIINACKAARFKNCFTVTFSGFSAENPLRKEGNVNFYVPSGHYGFVELAHQTLLHCILDIFLKRMHEYNF